MKRLFTLDMKNYSEDMPVFERYAVRAIICKDGKYLMQQSKEGDYKIPGGGIDAGETKEQALIREVQEETGYLVEPDTIQGVGEILEKRIDCFNDQQIFIAHSYFYICEVGDTQTALKMTASELKLGYHPQWETLDKIIQTNEEFVEDYWQERDQLFLKWYKDNKLSNNVVDK